MAWIQIPQHTFRGPVKSIPGGVRAVLVGKGGPTGYEVGGHVMEGGQNIMADQYIFLYNVSSLNIEISAHRMILLSTMYRSVCMYQCSVSLGFQC